MLVLLFALLAASCGGSDDTAADGATSEPTAAADDTGIDDTGTDDGASSSSDDDPLSQTSDLAPPPEVEYLQERDCAHTIAAVNGEEEPEVVLPPNEKPPVDDEFLGSVDDLITTDLIEGTGAEAVAGSTVTMQYVGVLGADGTEFDASWNSGNPFTFTLGAGQVIAGWDQGIEGMRVGGRRVLQIPSDLAYGDQDRSEIIVAGSDLVFIVDLIDVGGAGEPAPPVDDSYLGSFSELEVVDVVEGEGCEAQIGDIVYVNYVGVEAGTGEQFDDSWSRGELFPLIVGRSQVIDGWNDGLVGMKVGGERILQIPAGLAYDDSDLVFLVRLEELIEAPVAHTLEFDGDAPDEIEIETLVEGDGGQAVESGDVVNANIAVLLWDSGTVLQSTWLMGTSAQVALDGAALLPGLENNIVGTLVGETREIVLPVSVAYPDGAPAGIEEGDAVVFVIEVLEIVS